ncbi:MAG: hypothetical protein R3F37_22935 [Candidatus Competibacteraceae bacterium]
MMAGTLALTEAYAMTQVDTLRKMAERIQARAIRRCGELLKQVETGQGVRTTHHDAADMKLTRTEAATQAGLSERQKVTARFASPTSPPVNSTRWWKARKAADRDEIGRTGENGKAGSPAYSGLN